MEDERKSQQNLTNVPRRITVTFGTSHTHLFISAHYTCGQKHTMWHSLNGMVTFKNIWHDSGFNMSLYMSFIIWLKIWQQLTQYTKNTLTEYKTHFLIQLKNRGSSLYARLSYIQVNMYLSLSSINTLSYVKKYYCKTLSPGKMDSVKKLMWWWLSNWIRMCWHVLFNYNITVLKHAFTR